MLGSRGILLVLLIGEITFYINLLIGESLVSTHNTHYLMSNKYQINQL